MKVGAGAPQVQTMEEFHLGNRKTGETLETVKNPERIEAKDGEGKNVTASWDKVVKTVEELNKFSILSNSHLQFQIHDRTKRLMVKVVDENGEVLREIPTEEAMEMLANLQDSAGAILDRYI